MTPPGQKNRIRYSLTQSMAALNGCCNKDSVACELACFVSIAFFLLQ